MSHNQGIIYVYDWYLLEEEKRSSGGTSRVTLMGFREFICGILRGTYRTIHFEEEEKTCPVGACSTNTSFNGRFLLPDPDHTVILLM